MATAKVIRRIKRIIRLLIILVSVTIISFPIIWTLMGSFKTEVDYVAYPPKFFFAPTLSNYMLITERTSIMSAMKNSIIVCTLSTLLGLLFGVPAAYILGRFNFRYKNSVRFWFLSMLMLPPVSIVIPLYRFWNTFRLYDTYIALISTYLLTSIPLVVWLITDYFAMIPRDIEEAARVDGCTLFQTFIKISLPVSVEAIAFAGVFSFVWLWNEFFIAFVLTTENITLPVAVAASAKFGLEIPWGLISANTIVLLIPSLILAIVFRSFILKMTLFRW